MSVIKGGFQSVASPEQFTFSCVCACTLVGKSKKKCCKKYKKGKRCKKCPGRID